tara:strand:+ start:864 stop:1145 length:282 start_codon:yes stop_codon:yes gene_type:complete
LLALAIIQFNLYPLYGKLCNMLKFVGLGGRLVFDTRLGVVIKLKCTLFRLLKIFKEDPSEASCYSSAAKENGTKTECLGVCLDFFLAGLGKSR